MTKPPTVTKTSVGWGGGADAYLTAIYVLLKEEPQEQVVAARVADYLGVSAVSVSRALTRLQDVGDIEQKVPSLVLTTKGWEHAESLLRRHHITERWLTDELAMDWAEAHHEAEILGTAMSDHVAQALWEHLGRPLRCPHGTPIPGTGAAEPLTEPLSDVSPGTYVIDRVLEQVEGFSDLLRQLQSDGLTPGTAVEVLTTPRKGETSVRVMDASPHTWVSLEPWLARRVLVRSEDRAL